MSAWPAGVTTEVAHQVFQQVNDGKRVSVVGIDFGLLDTEVRQIVTRVRADRAARASTRPSAQPSPQPRPSASSSAPAAAASTRVSGPPGGGQDGAAASGPPPAGQRPPTGSRVGAPQLGANAEIGKYLVRPDKKIAKAAATAQKAVSALAALVFTWEAAEQQRQEAERARTEAQRQVDELEEQLREAREKLAAATGKKKPAKKAAQSSGHTQEGPTAAEIRQWAVNQGMDVPSVGRVPAHVREAYEKAHPVQPDSPGADAEVQSTAHQEAS